MLHRSNFSSFPQYFQYISNLGVKLRIHSVKGGCSINCFFLSSVNLICRTTDISKCFIESLGVRDNESRLYLTFKKATKIQTRLSNLVTTFKFCCCFCGFFLCYQVETAAIVMYMYLYSLAFIDHPCTLGAAVCHQAPP